MILTTQELANLKSESDALLEKYLNTGSLAPEEIASALRKAVLDAKIFPIFVGGSFVAAGRNELIKSGLVHFTFPRDVVDSLDYLGRNSPKRKPSSGHHVFGHHGDFSTSSSNGTMMDFEETLN